MTIAEAEIGTGAEQATSTQERVAAAAAEATGNTATKEKKGQQLRPYHVLLDVSEEGAEFQTLRKVGTYTAAGDKQAIKLALAEGALVIGGKFVAVADSGWHEHAPKLKEVEPKLAW